MARKIKYTEPAEYFPKEIRDKLLSGSTEKKPKKGAKTTSKPKKK